MPANPFQSGLSVQVSGDATGANRALQSVMGNLTSMKVLAAGAGVAIAAAIGVKSVNAAREFQDAMNESLAIMGDVSDAMRDDMSQAARDVATQTRFSAEEAAESYFFLASAGLDAKESIAALPQVAQFAQAGMFDMATATDLLTDAQSALGKTMDDPQANMREMAKLSDILVKANTLANASVEQFSEALTNKAAPAMRNNNIATEEGVAVLAAFADAGLKGRRAGTILARTIQGLQKRANENEEAFRKFGIRVFDANGEMRSFADISEDLTDAFEGMSVKTRAQAFEQLGFNRRTRRGINLLIGQEDALREYTSGLRDAGGTTEEVANKQMESFNAKLDILKSELNNVAITIGNALLPALEDLVVGLTDVTRSVNDSLSAWEIFGRELKQGGISRALEVARKGTDSLKESTDGVGASATRAEFKFKEFAEGAKTSAETFAEETKASMDGAKDSVNGFIDSMEELRRGAVGGLSTASVRRMVEERLPELMEQAEQPGGLTDPRKVNLAMALQRAQKLIEAGEFESIQQLGVDNAEAIAQVLAQERRERQGFLQAVFDRLRGEGVMAANAGGPAFRGATPPRVGRQLGLDLRTDIEVEIEGTDELTTALADAANIVVTTREERTDRFNPGASPT